MLDLTCEHAETKGLLSLEYREVQVLDLTLPHLETLHEVATFVATRRHAGGVVYVHDAQGYGRSAIAVAASLLAADPELTVDHVIETVREVRPNVRLANESARRLLHRYRDRLRAGDG